MFIGFDSSLKIAGVLGCVFVAPGNNKPLYIDNDTSLSSNLKLGGNGGPKSSFIPHL